MTLTLGLVHTILALACMGISFLVLLYLGISVSTVLMEKEGASKKILDRWGSFAADRGWVMKPVEHALEGESRGVQARVDRFSQRVDGWPGKRHTRVRATQVDALRHLRFGLQRALKPKGDDVVEAHDSTHSPLIANVCAGSPTPVLVRQLLVDPQVRRWLDSTEALDWHNGVVTCRFEGLSPDALPERVDMAVAQVETLVGAIDRFAKRLAERTGLSTVPDPDRVLPRFRGQVEGTAVELRQVEGSDAMQVTATLPVPVDGLRIVLKTVGSESGIALGDPILDPVVSVMAADPSAMRMRLQNDATREDLLVVLMGYPSATVDGCTVTLTCSPTPDAVAQAVADAVSLARALSPDLPGDASSSAVTRARPRQRTT